MVLILTQTVRWLDGIIEKSSINKVKYGTIVIMPYFPFWMLDLIINKVWAILLNSKKLIKIHFLVKMKISVQFVARTFFVANGRVSLVFSNVPHEFRRF